MIIASTKGNTTSRVAHIAASTNNALDTRKITRRRPQTSPLCCEGGASTFEVLPVIGGAAAAPCPPPRLSSTREASERRWRPPAARAALLAQRRAHLSESASELDALSCCVMLV